MSHEYVHPTKVVEVTPPRKSTEHDDFIDCLPEYVAEIIDLNANVIELRPNENRAA